MHFIVGIILGAVFSGFFAFAAGIDVGHQRSYNHCVEQEANKQMLRDARIYCGAITGKSK